MIKLKIIKKLNRKIVILLIAKYWFCGIVKSIVKGKPDRTPTTKNMISTKIPIPRSMITEAIARLRDTSLFNKTARIPSPPKPVGRKLLLNKPAP